jgi:hypothetical protein
LSARADVTVVVPSRGRRETRLAFLYQALERQTLSRDRFEVVVVRDMGAPGPLASIPDGLRVRELASDGQRNIASNRNLGWRAATGPLVAFTDDDCRPAPDWLESLLAATAEGTFVQGRTVPDPDEEHLLWGLARSQNIIGPSDWYETCNLAYPVALLEELGGFDERLALIGEDTDLALRAEAAGARRVYEPGALVWHAVHPRRPLPAAREVVGWTDLPLVFALHPGHRGALEAGVFVKGSHWKLLLALAGVLSRRAPLAVLAAIPYANYVVRHHRRSPRGVAIGMLDLPGRALLDAAEVITLARGSLRHRALLL